MSKNELKIAQEIQDAEDAAEKENIIFIIQKYQSSERFGNYVKNDLKVSYSADALNKKSLYQLQAILHKIRLHLDNQNLSKLYDGMLFAATTAVEKISSKTFANVDGYSNLLLQSEEFLNAWERVKCDSISMPTIPSHLQLMIILGQTYFMAYAINKSEERLNEPAPPEVQAVIDEVNKQFETDKKEQIVSEDKEEEIKLPTIENGMSI